MGEALPGTHAMGYRSMCAWRSARRYPSVGTCLGAATGLDPER